MHALNDENIQGQVPTTSEIARQSKRVRHAEALECHPDYEDVTEEDVGLRIVRLNSMVTSHIINNELNFTLNDLIQGVRQAIRDECQPGGAIHGAIHQGIHTECQPGGAIHGAIHQGINSGRALDRAIASAQYANSKLTIRSSNVTPIPLEVDAHLNLDIPATVSDFFGMKLAQIDSLLLAYSVRVRQGASRNDKLNALADYFRLSVVQV